MNKKILLAAMALPMLFTACSQDEYMEGLKGDMQTPDVKGFEVTLAPSLGFDGNSRAEWDFTGNRLSWEKTDLISVYWLNDQEDKGTGTNNVLKGMYNSIFKTTDGASFTSESLVFEGGNIAVFPANTTFVSQGDIKLSVPYSQDETVINKVPYFSNYLKVSADNIGKNVAGYNNGLDAPVKPAANVVYLDVNLANTAELVKNYAFTVDSISIEANSNAFANEATLLIDGTPTYKSEYEKTVNGTATKVATITKSVKVNATAASKVLTSTSVEKTGEGKYRANFVILPTAANSLNVADKIVIYTNCGRLELTSSQLASTAAAGSTATPVKSFDNDVTEGASQVTYTRTGVVTGAKKTVVTGEEAKEVAWNQTIAEFIRDITAVKNAAETSAKFKGEKQGRPMLRAISGDMANATLDYSKVYNSDQIKKYIAIHTAMNSKQVMNLVLCTNEKNSGTFKSLTSEVVNLIDKKNVYVDDLSTTDKNEISILVKLSTVDDKNQTVCDTIQLATAGAVYALNGEAINTPVVMTLPEGQWNMDDTLKVDKVSKIINYGTLAIAGTEDKDGNQNKLTTTLKNEGIINIAGNNTLYLNGEIGRAHV